MAWAHICVDMQRLFAEQTPWHTPWMARIAPAVCALVAAHPVETIFTRFVPPHKAEQASGAWRTYYEQWDSVTLDRIGTPVVELMPELQRFVPPAMLLDKPVYSPWLDGRLSAMLKERQADTLVISGGETDVCVLATVMGAIDYGFTVIVARDALCSSRDETHDSSIELYEKRFSKQIRTLTVQEVLAEWVQADDQAWKHKQPKSKV